MSAPDRPTAPDEPPPLDAAPVPATAAGRWLARRARVLEALALAAVLAYDAMYLQVLHVGLGTLPLAGLLALLAVDVLIMVMLLRRRRRPRAAALTVLAASWASILLGASLSPMPLVALGIVSYHAGSRLRGRSCAATLVIVTLWLLAAGIPLVEQDYLRISHVALLILAAALLATLGRAAQGRRRHLDRLARLTSELAAERDARAAMAVAQERTRIAREMHDVVAHGLGTMVVLSDAAARTASADPEQAARAMARVRDTGREAMGEMRRTLGVLRSGDPSVDTDDRAPQPGLDRLDELVEATRATGLRVDRRIAGSLQDLPAGLDLAAYRIVQEALTNARRHGGPLLRRIVVEIDRGEHVLSLRITDDGSPAPDARPQGTRQAAGTGLGLLGMRERAAAYGGRVNAGPRPEGGFRVDATLPIDRPGR